MSDKEPLITPPPAEVPEPRCVLCLDTGYVAREGGGGRTVCSCGQLLDLLYSTFEDMKAYLIATGLELRISPGVMMREWTVHLHSVTEYNVGVGQDLDLLQALRQAIQSAMRRTSLRPQRLAESREPRR